MAVLIVLVLSPLIFVAIGALIGHPWCVAFPIVAIPLLYTGMDKGWWGNGVGDAWQVPMVLFILVGVLTALAGVRIRTTVSRTGGRRHVR